VKTSLEDFEREYTRLTGLLTAAPPEGFAAGAGLSVPVPPTLRFVLSWAGRSRLNQIHNELLDPATYAVDDERMVAFATENQNVVSWGFRAEPADNPLIYQKAHGEDGEGPWVEDGKTMSEFLIAHAYWNAANGGADATVVGEIGPTTRMRLQPLETVFTTNDFSVQRSGDVFLIVTSDDDFFAFGKNQLGLRWLVDELDPAWSDYE
jgi:hypothetical protein